MIRILLKYSFRSIVKNKLRTVSTIIGIALSVILMTVIVLLSSSISTSMVNEAVEKYGDWHIMSKEITDEQIYDMYRDNIIDDICYVENVGYMSISDCKNENKPYIHVANISTNFSSFININIISGRMPEKENEIVVTEKFISTYTQYSLYSEIFINFGSRINILTGEVLYQNSSYLGSSKEYIKPGEVSKNYHIVGIIERVESIEYEFSPAYTFLSYSKFSSVNDATTTYIKLRNLTSNYNKITNYISEQKVVYNNDLLNYLGVTDGENLQDILTTIVVILMTIIILAVFILVNNSIATSSDERSKQFGVLSSIGMTMAQTLLMYFSEILLIGIISIAIGLGTGVGLFYLLFKCIGSWIIKTSFSINKLTVDINVLYLVFIVILIVAIIFIASAVNAIKCITGNNIDKIRKVKDIKSKKVANKNRYLSVEWNIVLKSFFRYNKKYRYTIIALLLSVVLFISCGSFNAYADYYIKELLPVAGYDIQINSRQSDIYTIIEQQYGIFSQIEELTDSGWISMLPAGYIMLSDVETDDFYRDYATNHNIDKVDVTYTFIDDNSFNTLCNLENKDFSQYYTDTGRVLVYDNLNCYINGEQYALRFFKNSYNQFNLLYMNSKNLDEYYSTNLFDGNYYEKNILAEVISKDNFSIELKSISDQNGIFFILPISMLNCFSEDVPTSVQMYFSADNYSLVAQEIEEIKNSNNWNVSIDKVAERYDKERNTYALYELFMIVFTILISFVSIVNTYNSVTSNLISRKKEFAVMQSIGLSKVSYIKIVLNECILISGVVLSCSIILSIAVSWILSLSFALDNYIFYYPWKYFLLASICLIVIILSSIIMPAYKIKNQNIIKTIKEDMN